MNKLTIAIALVAINLTVQVSPVFTQQKPNCIIAKASPVPGCGRRDD